MDSVLFSPLDCAKACGISPDQVRYYMKKGKVNFIKKGKRYFMTPAEVKRFYYDFVRSPHSNILSYVPDYFEETIARLVWNKNYYGR